ncbi:ankyrin repeat protein [Metarhizium robertsii]|uniref:Ankyrin repeat protein n=2 Tax=Metarhizium robertsii TaxID=568076 RepID=A0A014QR30_9HYPO|nr:ankyrin repeat protein [Metarhizium robertsii]
MPQDHRRTIHSLWADSGEEANSSPPKDRNARILHLPNELIFEIAGYVVHDDDLSCLVRTCRFLFDLLNSELYTRSLQRDYFVTLWAAKTGSVATMKRALEMGADVNVKASGFIKLVTDISPHRHSPTFCLVQTCYDIHGKTPLILAAEGGHFDIIRLLLQKPDVNISAAAFGLTATHYAALKGHHRVLELLLSYGPLSTDWCSAGRTPLHLAAANGYEKAVSLLLDKLRQRLFHRSMWPHRTSFSRQKGTCKDCEDSLDAQCRRHQCEG